MRAANLCAKTRFPWPRLQEILWIGRRFLRPRVARPRAADRLDPRTLSDHLKRDLGLIDGNDPKPPHR